MIYQPMDDNEKPLHLVEMSYSTAWTNAASEPVQLDPDVLKVMADHMRRQIELRDRYWFLIPPHQRNVALKMEFDPIEQHIGARYMHNLWGADYDPQRSLLLNVVVYG